MIDYQLFSPHAYFPRWFAAKGTQMTVCHMSSSLFLQRLTIMCLSVCDEVCHSPSPVDRRGGATGHRGVARLGGLDAAYHAPHTRCAQPRTGAAIAHGVFPLSLDVFAIDASTSRLALVFVDVEEPARPSGKREGPSIS